MSALLIPSKPMSNVLTRFRPPFTVAHHRTDTGGQRRVHDPVHRSHLPPYVTFNHLSKHQPLNLPLADRNVRRTRSRLPTLHTSSTPPLRLGSLRSRNHLLMHHSPRYRHRTRRTTRVQPRFGQRPHRFGCSRCSVLRSPSIHGAHRTAGT